jgi:hypothetical protein
LRSRVSSTCACFSVSQVFLRKRRFPVRGSVPAETTALNFPRCTSMCPRCPAWRAMGTTLEDICSPTCSPSARQNMSVGAYSQVTAGAPGRIRTCDQRIRRWTDVVVTPRFAELWPTSAGPPATLDDSSSQGWIPREIPSGADRTWTSAGRAPTNPRSPRPPVARAD